MIKYKFSRGDEIEIHLRVNSFPLKFGTHFEFIYEDEGELQAQIENWCILQKLSTLKFLYQIFLMEMV